MFELWEIVTPSDQIKSVNLLKISKTAYRRHSLFSEVIYIVPSNYFVDTARYGLSDLMEIEDMRQVSPW